MFHRISRLLLVVCASAAVLPFVTADAPASAATASVDCTPQPAGAGSTTAPLKSFTAVNPVRLVDTRNNIGGVGVPIDAGCTLRVNVGANVPANASAVSLSMTAVSDVADYLTVYPCAAGRPETSNLNSRAGVPTPNLVVAIPDANRQICIFSHGRSNLIVDLGGWWSDGPDRFASIEPERVYDSRRFGNLPLEPFQVRQVAIPATTVAADARVAVFNLTTTRSTQDGFIVAFPCAGQPVPLASNLNFLAGEDRAVGAIVGLGLGRTLCLMSDVTTDVIVDVTGYYGPAPTFSPTASLQPDVGRRVVDSRNGIGGPQQRFAAGETRSFDPVAGRPDAASASAVSLNFISTRATADGFLTVFPCEVPRPEVSALNFSAGQEATNLTTVKLGADRRICVYASAPTDVIVDVFGVMSAPTGSPFERLTFDKPTWPAFDPSATDYAIECGAGAGTASVSVGMTLLPLTTATISVNGGTPSPISSGSTSFALRTDQPFVLRTLHQGVAGEYHLRCLPTDFPTLSVDRPGNPTAGWYLTTLGFQSPSGSFAVIFDEYGAPVWYRRAPQTSIDLKRLSDGRLAFTPAGGPFGINPAQGYWVTPLAGAPTELLQTADPVALPTDHHDLLEIPGGHTLLSYPIVTGQDLRPIGGSATDSFADGVIQEVVSGSAAWTWTTSDHFGPNESTLPIRFRDQNPTLPSAFDAWDVFHLNSIDRMPDGDYVVSARHLDAVFRVDRVGGGIDWVLGGPAPTASSPDPGRPAPLTIVGDPYNGPRRPHDARMVGNVVTMFDNQAGMPGRQSRAVAYRINGSTATMLWEIRHPAGFTGDTLGSVGQAADGSVLVGWGAGLQPIIEEFAPNGRRLLSIGLPSGGNSYRVVKYPKSGFDVSQLRAEAGGAIASP